MTTLEQDIRGRRRIIARYREEIGHNDPVDIETARTLQNVDVMPEASDK